MNVNQCTREEMLECLHNAGIEKQNERMKLIKNAQKYRLEWEIAATAEGITTNKYMKNHSKYKIDCDIPFRDEVIEQLKNKNLYFD